MSWSPRRCALVSIGSVNRWSAPRSRPAVLSRPQVEVPRFDEARLTEAALTQLVPVEYHADAVVLFDIIYDRNQPVFGTIFEEFLMDTQDIVETWRREAVQEGVQTGPKQGLEQGLEQGVKQGVAHSLVEVYEARFGAMPEDLRAVVEDTDDEPTLVAWLRLAGTRGAGEIAAAIRAFRAS
jgi:flagellar biosynthesis/type III secretory pathway protein FliH